MFCAGSAEHSATLSPRVPRFDPEHPGPMPDPERWLPKWQRAEARKGRKKRRDKVRAEELCGGGSDVTSRLFGCGVKVAARLGSSSRQPRMSAGVGGHGHHSLWGCADEKEMAGHGRCI